MIMTTTRTIASTTKIKTKATAKTIASTTRKKEDEVDVVDRRG